jgi:hypothetical protein
VTKLVLRLARTFSAYRLPPVANAMEENCGIERVNLKWLERWRNHFHFVDPVANITEDQLDEKVESLIDTMHHRGERIVWSWCEASLGGPIRRKAIRDAILRVDPRDPSSRKDSTVPSFDSTRVRSSGTYAFMAR